MKVRNESLDALRGIAILAMILSGSISFGDVLPGWMYHAQVPPPKHLFNPALPGITWVDLVFPFFLFSMGAAIPFSLKKYTGEHRNWMAVLRIAAKRFVLLVFFALFTQHMKAWVITSSPDTTAHLLSLLAFALLCVQFYETKHSSYKKIFLYIKWLAFAAGVALLWWLPFKDGKGFDFYRSDIIIMVLANMAFFGTLVYYATADTPVLRIGLLPLIMAVFLASKEPVAGWAKVLYGWDHIGDYKFDWLYRFYFLKYLFIIIPGTIAGEWMLAENQQSDNKPEVKQTGIAVLLVLIILVNLVTLYSRMLLPGFIATIVLCSIVYALMRKRSRGDFYYKMTAAGTYLLLLGLFFEAYEGGIKKDPSTYSYYFVTAGMAFYSIVIFSVMRFRKIPGAVTHYLALNGQNPMVAYVAGSLVVLPLMELSGIKPYWDSMQQNALMGLLKGLVFTATVSAITLFFVRMKWYWKS